MDFDEPYSLAVCRICLGMDLKLFPMQKYKLNNIYHQVTGLSMNSSLPQYVCFECATRLTKTSIFIEKAIKTHYLLSDLLEKHTTLSIDHIKSIDRQTHQLESELTCQNKINVINITDLIDTVVKVEHISLKTDPDVEFHDETIFSEVNNIFVSSRESSVTIFDHNTNESKSTEFDNDNTTVIDTLQEKDVNSDKNNGFIAKRKTRKNDNNHEVKLAKGIKKRDVKHKKVLKESKRIFTVTKSSYEEQISTFSKRKESENFKRCPLKCMDCFKGFLDDKAYNNHLLRHTDEWGKYECDICKARFKSPHTLLKHKTDNHMLKFSCNECNFETIHRNTARIHERWHKGAKYQCTHCPEEFIKQTSLYNHLRIKHPSDFVCELCGFSFVSENGKAIHILKKHRLENLEVPRDGPECIECNIRFASNGALNTHRDVSVKHGNLKRNDSQQQDRRTGQAVRKSQKKTGLNEKTGRLKKNEINKSKKIKPQSPIVCEQCGHISKTNVAHCLHFSKAHPDCTRTQFAPDDTPSLCSLCGKTFKDANALRLHRHNTHSGHVYTCEICNKQFKKKNVLSLHLNVHTGKKYPCPKCGRSFSQMANMNRHLTNVHTDVRSVKCEFCTKCFKSVPEMRVHTAHVHFNMPYKKRTRKANRERTELTEDFST